MAWRPQSGGGARLPWEIMLALALVVAVLVPVSLAIAEIRQGGGLGPPPSREQTAAFAAGVRHSAISQAPTPVRLNRVEVLRPRYSPDDWVTGLAYWDGSRYAVHYELTDCGAQWVEVVRPEHAAVDCVVAPSDFDTPTVKAMAAFNRLVGTPTLGLPEPDSGGAGVTVPLGARLWDAFTFEPGAGADRAWGRRYWLVEHDNGEFTLASDAQ